MAFTYFFRDSQPLELAIDEAIPSLRGRAFIHVWDAGCAHGPEPYTLAVLLRERMSDHVFRNVHIHATDVDSSFAAQVTSGDFPDREVKRIPPEIIEKHFRPAGKKGASPHLCEAGHTPEADRGPFRQTGIVPFFPAQQVAPHAQVYWRVHPARMEHRARESVPTPHSSDAWTCPATDRFPNSDTCSAPARPLGGTF